MILLENKNGRFVDVTANMGINVNEQTTSAVAADFNNDGWDDLLLARYGNMATENTQILYLNKNGKSFERQESDGVFSTDLGATGSGADIIDYDRDGDMDIVMANERGRWHLYTNNSEKLNSNNFIGVQITNSPSGKASAFGASATVTACSMETTRVVGNTSSSFAVTHNTDLLVGLGQCNNVDKITVKWTNGETLELLPKTVNQYLSTK